MNKLRLNLKILPVLAAMAFIFSCSSGGGSDSNGGDPSYSSGGGGNSSSSGGNSGVTYEGETYQTVVIGTKTWFAKNLNYNASGSRCYGDNTGGDSKNNCTKYGRLYDWATAKTACPPGWHLPNKAEWEELIEIAGGFSTAGAKLKARSGWDNGGDGTDNHGFSALPGGQRGFVSGGTEFFYVGIQGFWWTATEYGTGVDAYSLSMEYRYSSASISYEDKARLNSVRCIKD